DGDVFQLPSTCNHIMTKLCGSSYETFNIQLRRQVQDSEPTISKITMKLDGTVNLAAGSFMTDESSLLKQYYKKSCLFFSLQVELDPKFRNQTCGLCGDFNEIPTYNEFIRDGVLLSTSTYGNLWKMDGPTEICEDEPERDNVNCGNEVPVATICQAFSSCTPLISVEQFAKVCVEDQCQCNTTGAFCLCKTLAEYSRQCVHAGGQPANWRTEQFCPMTCPKNKVYMECGSPCMDTCSNPERKHTCGEHCIDGCFCPPGTVLDDISNTGCIPLSNCTCKFVNSSNPNVPFSTCSGGTWNCVDKDCPGMCSVQGGAHIITYDEKPYTFHGDCSYVLSKVLRHNYKIRQQLTSQSHLFFKSTDVDHDIKVP
uniref:VWFD domain-containing protein n=1 Tax=Pygocentrus nattereri TaxID=42514 RepID=A0A3B4D6A6_PYGNA